MKYAPDKNDPLPKHKNGSNGGKDKKGGHGPTMKIGFMPGQIGGMAEDMSDGDGGTDAKWRDYLRDVYSPVKVPYFNFGGGGGGGNGGGKDVPVTGNNDGGGNPNPVDPGFDPSRPRKMVMPAQPMQSGFLHVGPAGQRMPPAMGLLGQPQQNAQAPRGGMLPPEIQLLLAQRR